MTQTKHSKTTFFQRSVAAAFLLFLSLDVQASAKNESLLEGDDTEAKIHFAHEMFQEDIVLNLSEFKKLPGTETGLNHMENFEEAKKLFLEISTKRNAALEALSLMKEEHPENQKATTHITPVDITINDEGHPMHFQPALNWDTILLKLKGLPTALSTLSDQLEEAFETHHTLKEKKLQGDYEELVLQLEKAAAAFEKINDLYEKPIVPFMDEVRGDDLETLKAKVPAFKKSVEAYGKTLKEAKAWERTFQVCQLTYGSLVKVQGKLKADFEALKKSNEDNPHVLDVADLTDLSIEGDLVKLQKALIQIQTTQRLQKTQLVEAKQWKPPVVKDAAKEKEPEAVTAKAEEKEEDAETESDAT